MSRVLRFSAVIKDLKTEQCINIFQYSWGKTTTETREMIQTRGDKALSSTHTFL